MTRPDHRRLASLEAKLAPLGAVAHGQATLVAGTATVSDAGVTANSRILLTHQNGVGTIGFLRVSARTPGTSFTITSANVLDTSTVAWLRVEP